MHACYQEWVLKSLTNQMTRNNALWEMTGRMSSNTISTLAAEMLKRNELKVLCKGVEMAKQLCILKKMVSYLNMLSHFQERHYMVIDWSSMLHIYQVPCCN